MAIEEFANSLLAGQRQYNEEMYQKRRREDKKDSKDMLKDMLKMRLISGTLDVGLKIGSDLVKERTQNYVNSQEVLDKRVLVGKATDTVGKILDMQKQIDKHQGGIDDYFENIAKEEVESEMDTNALNLETNKYSNTQVARVQGIVANDRAKELKTQYLKSLKAAQELAAAGVTDMTKFNEALVENAPSTITGYFANKVRGLFSGTDPIRNSITATTMYETAKDKQEFLNAYDNLFDGDVLASNSYVQTIKSIEKTTGMKFSWGKPDKTYGEFVDVTIKVPKVMGIGHEIQTVKARELLLNGTKTGVMYNATGEPISEDVLDTTPLDINLQDADLKPIIEKQAADTVSFTMSKLDEKQRTFLKQYIQIATGADSAADTADTGGADDAQDQAILNNIYGKMFITRRAIQENYGLNAQGSNELAVKMHILNMQAQEANTGNPLDDFNNISEIEASQAILSSQVEGMNQDGTWNSAAAIIVLNDEAVKSGNVDALGLRRPEDISNLYEMFTPQVSEDLGNMSLNGLERLKALLTLRIEDYKETYGEAAALNIRRLTRLNAQIKAEFNYRQGLQTK